MSNKTSSDKAMEWIVEADYIARVAADMRASGSSKEFSGGLDTWTRYCQMQYNSAMREGFYQIAQGILSECKGVKP